MSPAFSQLNLSNASLVRRRLLATAFALPLFCAFRPVRAAGPRRTLVVCHSRTGTTEALARAAAEALGADFRTIEPLEPDASGYDLVVASPVWWGGLSTPVSTYLADEARAGHLKGKLVATLHTSGSSGPDAARAEAERLVPDARFVGEPFIASGSRARTRTDEAQAWARQLLEEAL